jgi:hypothetical protein
VIWSDNRRKPAGVAKSADDEGVRFIVFILAAGALCSIAQGQTTRASGGAPSGTEVPVAWEREVSSIAAAAAGKDDETLQNLAGSDCQIRRFNSEHDEDVADLVDFASSVAVLGDHAYIFPASGSAVDIADDVNSSAIISGFCKRALDLDGKRDQTTVMQWMTSSLQAQDGALVGMVVMWDAKPETDDKHRLVFVLISAEKSGDGGFKVKRIVYGDPLQ